MSRKSRKAKTGTWWKMDLHLHTPASEDYLETGVTSLDFLQKAESKGLDIIAITDHNTVAGYRGLLQEIEDLTLLERLKRLRPEEKRRPKDWAWISPRRCPVVIFLCSMSGIEP